MRRRRNHGQPQARRQCPPVRHPGRPAPKRWYRTWRFRRCEPGGPGGDSDSYTPIDDLEEETCSRDTPRTFIGATTFQVTGMTCGHCQRAVTEEISRDPRHPGRRRRPGHRQRHGHRHATGRPNRRRPRRRRGRLHPHPLRNDDDHRHQLQLHLHPRHRRHDLRLLRAARREGAVAYRRRRQCRGEPGHRGRHGQLRPADRGAERAHRRGRRGRLHRHPPPRRRPPAGAAGRPGRGDHGRHRA